MATNTTIGSGTTLDFKIPLDVPVASIHNVIAEFFTDPNKTVKFSYIETDGFLKLNESTDPNELVGKIPSSETLKMRGCLSMRLQVIADETAETEDIGRSVPTPTKITFI